MLYDLILMGILAGILLGLAGTYTFVQNINYLAGAISHATMGGIGLALFLQINYGINFSIFYGALSFAVLFAIIISLVQTRYNNTDGIIGIAWAMGMSIGLLFLSLSPSFADPSVYLFGNIMLISKKDIIMTASMDLFIIIIFIVFYERLVLKLSDENFAKFSGLNNTMYNIITLLILAIVITLMINVIGIILIIAMLSIPASIARNFTKKLWQMAILSVLLAILFNVLGIYISIRYDVNSGPSIVLLSSLIYFLSLVVLSLKKHKSMRLILLGLVFLFSSCQSSRRTTSSCIDNSCIQNICVDFDSEDGEICKSSICTLELSLWKQEENTTDTSDVSCGPTSTSMILDAVAKESEDITGWMYDFSRITATYDPTNSSSGCENTLACRKIVATEQKMIPSYDMDTYKTSGASAEELRDMLYDRAQELNLSSNSTDLSTIPAISSCDFVSNDFKIDNTVQNYTVLLYLRFSKNLTASSTYQGVPLEDIKIDSYSSGHFIALSGYDASDGNNIYFMFNDPILGLVRYKLRDIETDEIYCVKGDSSQCELYQRFSFSSARHFTYLVATDGEEESSTYKYKIIVAVSSIEFTTN